MFISLRLDGITGSYTIIDSEFEHTIDSISLKVSWCNEFIRAYEMRDLNVAANIIRYSIYASKYFGARSVSQIVAEFSCDDKCKPYLNTIEKYLLLL